MRALIKLNGFFAGSAIFVPMAKQGNRTVFQKAQCGKNNIFVLI